MKKILFAMILLLVTSYGIYAQVKPPKAVLDALNRKFLGVRELKWSKENAHEYEAEFKWLGDPYSANFKSDGTWLETESPFSYDKLPAEVLQSFKKNHLENSVKEVTKIENYKGTVTYEVEVKLGNKLIEYHFDEKGSSIKD